MVDELVGRDDDVTQIRAARQRGAPGIVIAAPPGMGRSAVLSAMVAELQSRRADVLLIRPTASARSLRFSALGPLVTGDIDGPLVFDSVHDALVRRAAPGNFVLAVDDLHLVDEASARVIADFIGHPGTFVLATIDETYLGIDPITSAGSLEVHTLGPLSRRELGAMLALHLGTNVDPGLWFERSGGNPTALLDALSSDDADVGHADLPPAVRGLDAAARKLLTVVALAEPFPLAAARTVADADAVGHVLDSGLVASWDDGTDVVLRLRHPGHGPAIRRSLGPLETRGARRAAVLALRRHESTGTADSPRRHGPARLRLAALAIDAGVELDDTELAEVARLAPSAGDPHLALRLAREAARRLGRFEDHRLLADVAHEQGEVDDVEAALEAMDDAATAPEHRTAIAVARSQHLLWRLADADGATRALDAIDIDGDPEAAAVRARLLATIGRTNDAIVAAAPLLDHPNPRVRTQATLGTAHALRLQGRAAEAVAVLDRAIEAVQAVQDPVLSVSPQVLTVAQVLALIEAGRWAEADERAVQMMSYAERYDETAGRAIAMLMHGIAQLDSGAPATAIDPLDDALELFERIRQPAGCRWALAARALAHGLMGEAALATGDLDRLHRLAAHPADLLPSLEARARAWVLVARGEPEGARTHLADAAAAFVERGLHGAAWACAHDLLSLDRPALLGELAPIEDEPFCALRLRHAAAVQTRDLAALSALIDEYTELGGHRWAAEAATSLSHAASRVGAKEVVRRAGDRLAAATARCTGLAIPSISIGAAVTLSPREREIALLAARGLTSRAISDRLGLSIRTVDNHLARCFDKLGVNSRADLADLVGI